MRKRQVHLIKSTNVRIIAGVTAATLLAGCATSSTSHTFLLAVPHHSMSVGDEALVREGTRSAAKGQWEDARRAFAQAVTASNGS